ncbi:DsrE family protein [Dyadobacter frigoris]|nr:DsrE family protein [Dyadobacter frigoris]
MKRSILFVLVIVLINTSSWGQSASPKPSRFKSFQTHVASKAIYPLIKSSRYSGVVPVPNVDELPDPNMQYKLLMDVSTGMKDSASANEINDGLAEVARAINTHIAAGVPKNKIDVIVVVHGGAMKAFYTNAVYKSQYHVDNPNMALFDELLALPVKFVACGQSISFQNITKGQLVPWMKIALSAQIPISTYQLKGFVYKKVETE